MQDLNVLINYLITREKVLFCLHHGHLVNINESFCDQSQVYSWIKDECSLCILLLYNRGKE